MQNGKSTDLDLKDLKSTYPNVSVEWVGWQHVKSIMDASLILMACK